MLSHEEEKDIRDKISALKATLNANERAKKIATIDFHKSFVGKCYKKIGTRLSNDCLHNETYTKYVKILSEVSENEYRVECVSFTLPLGVRVDFRTRLSMTANRYPDSSIECEPFVVFSEMLSVLKDGKGEYTEISPDEFNTARELCFAGLVAFMDTEDLSEVLKQRRE